MDSPVSQLLSQYYNRATPSPTRFWTIGPSIEQMQVQALHRQAGSTSPDQCWRSVSLSFDSICHYDSIEGSSLIVFLDVSSASTAISRDERFQLSLAFGIPSFFWKNFCSDASGFFWAGDRECHALVGHVTCYLNLLRLLVKQRSLPIQHVQQLQGYHWEKFAFLTCWRPQGGLIVLCFDFPTHLKQTLGQDLLNSVDKHYGHGPFSLHPILLIHMVETFDKAVWSWRHVVRDLETTRPLEDTISSSSFESMHEAARHVIHCSEMLDTAISVIDEMKKEIATSPLANTDSASVAVVRDLNFCVTLLKGYLNRSLALKERLDNEINLVLHLNARRDGLATHRIATLTFRDGEVMKGISVLGMIFLPGTFVSAIFGMSFFDFAIGEDNGSGQWTLSNKFWLYWVVALPLTAFTLVLWYAWQRGRVRREERTQI